MNNRTVRLIRRAAHESQTNPRLLKRTWNRMSWKKRSSYRIELLQSLAQLD